MNLIKNLSLIPLFEGLPKDQYETLSTIVTDQVFDRGRLIFSEGEEGSGFYIVISGKVKIFKISFEGKEQILHILGPKEPFGEVSVFRGKKFPAYAETIEKSRLFFFSREAFTNTVRKNPLIAMNMLAVLSYRLRKFTLMIDSLSLKEVPGRLAAYLLYLNEQKKEDNHIELEITKGQIAGIIGTIPETLSFILTKMDKQGFIHSDGRIITLTDIQGLTELADGERRL